MAIDIKSHILVFLDENRLLLLQKRFTFSRCVSLVDTEFKIKRDAYDQTSLEEDLKNAKSLYAKDEHSFEQRTRIVGVFMQILNTFDAVLGVTFQFVDDSEREIQRILHENNLDRNTPKFQWPKEALSIVHEMQEFALQPKVQAYFYDGLKKASEWPSAASCNPHEFYTHDRDRNWFEKQGFRVFYQPYAFTNAWDKKLLDVAFLVPTRLDRSRTVRFGWFYHGGALCTGANDHIPWIPIALLQWARENNAIILSINYPLGPEGNYADICDSIREFLVYYKEDGFLNWPDSTDKELHWTVWLKKQIGFDEHHFDTDHVHIEGVSAGAALVVALSFINAGRETGTKIRIETAFCISTMIRHYNRFKGDDAPFPYMETVYARGSDQDPTSAISHANALVEETLRLEAHGLCTSRTKAFAPQDMANGVLLAEFGKWTPMFQRPHTTRHLADYYGKLYESDSWDGIERAEHQTSKIDLSYLPAFSLLHGHDDSFCPPEDIQRFVELLLPHYEHGAQKTPRVINVKGRTLPSGRTTEVGHAFTYQTRKEDEDWLSSTYDEIGLIYQT